MSPTSAAALNLGTTSDLYSEKALMPTFNDLDHMFESDSESSDADAVSFVQIQTVPTLLKSHLLYVATFESPSFLQQLLVCK